MKNTKLWLIVVLIILFGIGIGFFFFNKNKKVESNYDADKISTEYNNENLDSNLLNNNNSNFKNDINKLDSQNNTTSNNIINNNTMDNQNNTIMLDASNQNQSAISNELSSFSTKIYNKESERQNNVKLTCSSLNGIIVKNGNVFSFCNTLGPATPKQGYQKAEIFDNER